MSLTDCEGDHPLGPAEVRVRVYNTGEQLLLAVLALVLVLDFLITLGSALLARKSPPHAVAAGVGVFLLILLGTYAFRIIRFGRRVTVHRDGVEVATALRMRHFPWADLERAWERIVSQYMNGVHQWTRHWVVLEDARGRKAKFSGDPTEMTEIAAVVMQRSLPYLAAKILERFEAGETVSFGPIVADTDGLRTGWRDQLAWSEVADVRSENGSLGIFRRGSFDPWYIVEFGDVPNYRVLLGLAKHAIHQNGRARAANPVGRPGSSLPDLFEQSGEERPLTPTEVGSLQRRAGSLSFAAGLLAIAGIGATLGAGFLWKTHDAEARLRKGAKPTPAVMTVAELLRSGPKDNLHVRLTDMALDRTFAAIAYKKKYSDTVFWTHVYIPVHARTQAAGNPTRNLFVKAELTSREAVLNFCRKSELTGYLTQDIWPIPSREADTLKETFPAINPETVMVLDPTPREYPRAASTGRAFLILALAVCASACFVGFWILIRRANRARKQTFGLIDVHTNQPLRRVA
jgi:hypothetical protein